MKTVRLTIALLLLPLLSIYAQDATTAYIDQWYKKAVEEMWSYGIPASITLAQGIIESGSGKSALATEANNHFGIKCHKEWTGDTYTMDDDAKDECFRKYKDASESFDDHSLFLRSRDRYAFLFNLDKTDYKGWATGLKDAGYATNPKYPELLISTIERYDLAKYDKMSLRDIGEKDKNIAQNNNTSNPPAPYDNNLSKGQLEDKIDNAVHQHDDFYINRIRTIKAHEGDSPLEIAVRYGIPLKLLMRWNDMTDERQIPEGQNVFLQPKRSRAPGKDHIAGRGESMYDISQMYGIRLAKLYERNLMQGNEQPVLGENIILNGKRSDKPQTRTYGEVLKEKNEIAKKNLESKTNPVYLDDRVNNNGVYVEHIYVKAEDNNSGPSTHVSGVYSSGEGSHISTTPGEKISPSYVPPADGLHEDGDKDDDGESHNDNTIDYSSSGTQQNNSPSTSTTSSSEVHVYNNSSQSTISWPTETKIQSNDHPATNNSTGNTQANSSNSSSVSNTNTSSTPKAIYKYTVQVGDTLYNISKRFNCTVEQLKLWNLLLDNNIRIGQELIVSQ